MVKGVCEAYEQNEWKRDLAILGFCYIPWVWEIFMEKLKIYKFEILKKWIKYGDKPKLRASQDKSNIWILCGTISLSTLYLNTIVELPKDLEV